MDFFQQVNLWWSPAFRQQACCYRSYFVLQVSKYFLNDGRVFDTGNDVHGRTNAAGAWMRRSGDLHGTATFIANLNINIEDTFQPSCPLVRMSRCRVAQGCAGAARSLMPVSPLGFGLVPDQLPAKLWGQSKVPE